MVDYLIKYRRPGARTLDLDTIKKEKLGVFGTPENTCSIFREYEKIGVTHIIGMRAAGPPRTYGANGNPLVNLVGELSKKRERNSIFIQKPNFSLRLERRRAI